VPQTLLSERDLAAVNERLERCDPSEIVRWALGHEDKRNDGG